MGTVASIEFVNHFHETPHRAATVVRHQDGHPHVTGEALVDFLRGIRSNLDYYRLSHSAGTLAALFVWELVHRNTLIEIVAEPPPHASYRYTVTCTHDGPEIECVRHDGTVILL